jgi:hypothetical protein
VSRRTLLSWLGVLAFCAAVTTLHFVVHQEVILPEEAWSVPIDDTFIHLHYARGIAEGHPFSYHRGDGYSTGCTSPLYVVLLAVPNLLGLGDRMVPVTLVLGGVWLAASLLLLVRLGRQLGNRSAGVAAAVLWGGWGFAWYVFHSGMETGLYALMILLVLSLFVSWTRLGAPRPGWPLIVAAGLLPLTRPDGLFLLGALLGVVGLRVVLRRDRRNAWVVLGWWALTLIPALAYYLANRILTGTFSTAGMISKSLLHVPYMEPTKKAVTFLSHLFEAMRHFLSGNDANFLTFAVAGPGLAAVVALAVREHRRRAVGSRTVLACWALLMLAAASMHFIRIARWERYYMPVFLLAILGAGFAITWLARSMRRPWLIPGITLVLLLYQGDSTMRWIKAYERDLKTIHTKQAAAARTLLKRSPADARVLVCDAGAIPYLSRRWTFDIVGLTTPLRYNHFRNGVGSRFERFERIPKRERPNFIAAYGFCLWPGAHGPPIGRHHDMIVAPVAEKQAGTGHRPGTLPEGATIVDRFDVADLQSEHEHDYHYDPPGTIRDNVVRRGTVEGRKDPIADGGRLIHNHEQFALRCKPGRKATLVARLSCAKAQLVVRLNGRDHFYAKLPGTPGNAFTEVRIEIPAKKLAAENVVQVSTVSGIAFKSFHYFLLQ